MTHPVTAAAAAAPVISPFVANVGAFLTALSPVLTLMGVLGGVWLGGRMQTQQAQRIYEKQRLDRIEDAAAEAAKEADRKAEAKSYPIYLLAQHLERFAQKCAEVITYNDDGRGQGVAGLPTFPAWPATEWHKYGGDVTARLFDFRTLYDLKGSMVDGDVDENADDQEDAGGYYSEAAGRIGLEAWKIAESLRQEVGLQPFVFSEDAWNFVETMESRPGIIAARIAAHQANRPASDL
jgi:hypothetical protein